MLASLIETLEERVAWSTRGRGGGGFRYYTEKEIEAEAEVAVFFTVE